METVGALLREWRHRRRLSQLDLAIAADVSARHVSLVETGRSNPSADMVLRLADQLDVPLRERNRLLLAAGFAPRYTERPLGGDALSAARGAVTRVLRAHEPYPALAFDRHWNILMTNRAVDPFLATADPGLLRPPVNLVRLGLDPRGLAPLVVNLADVRARCSAPGSPGSWRPLPTRNSPHSTRTCWRPAPRTRRARRSTPTS
ncbi:helix-turn-helix domain-containing protein [Actinomadura darangshiensis]|uniref:helix-turn-helix domain-containing protein n=1 Tax=Actinomadura darangshiensis TaxID=705336 RepID=UPI00312CA328